MLRIHGSITPKLVIPILLVSGWATAVTCISKLLYDLGTDQVFITVLGFVVSLALSVRSSTSMDRYFQGRQLWDVFDLHRIYWRVWFGYTWKRDMASILDWESKICSARHVKKSPIPLGDLPLEILSHLSAYIKVLNDTRTLRDYSIYQTQSLDSLTIMDEVSCGTERILNTPLPLAYSIAIAQVTWLYILLLPFQCFNGLGWINIPACIVAAYIILGIAFIGHEIEDPFGHDVNDLPLDAFCQQIRQDVDIIMSRAALLANDFMGREENMPLYPLSYLRTRAWADKSPEEIHVALSQIIALHYPMVEHGENSPPPAQGRLGGVERWTEKGAPGPNETTGNYRKKYGSV
ncbi:hypothetical protein AA0121_g13218 [Alternaria tenuissima]|nr:hypothetical protein AA0121_g13218 [Alternaria tenuissima]